MKKALSIVLVFILSFSIIAQFNFFGNEATEQSANNDTAIDYSSLPKVRYYYRESNDNVAMTSDEETFETEMEPTDTVEVVFEMGYSPEPCNCRELLSLDSTDNEVDAIKEHHREEMKAFYSEKNAEFMESNDFLYDTENCEITVSEYSPFIQMVFDDFTGYEAYSDSIVDLADESDVSGINIGIPVEFEETATRVDTNNATTYYLEDAIEDIGASSQTYDGTGVKVGIIEAAGVTVSSDHPDLANLTIYTGGSSTHSEHAELVTRILCGSQGVARNVEAAYIYHTPLTVDMIDALNWMIYNGVDVVNQSLNLDEFLGQYHWISALLDTYIYDYFLTIVNSAGNEGNEDNHKIGPYAMGYNVIAVGNLDSENRVHISSSYGVDSYVYVKKPTFAAPGTKIKISTNDTQTTGNSISAPIVTGVIAKLIDENPGLAGFPEVLISSLIASATPVDGQGQVWDSFAGAGRINYQRARQAINNTSRIINSNNTSGTVVNREINVTTGRTLKFAAFWFAKPSTRTANDPVPSSRTHTEYDLFIENSSGTKLARSTTLTNIEYIIYTGNTTDKLYIVLHQYGAQKDNRTDYGGISWIYE